MHILGIVSHYTPSEVVSNGSMQRSRGCLSRYRGRKVRTVLVRFFFLFFHSLVLGPRTDDIVFKGYLVQTTPRI